MTDRYERIRAALAMGPTPGPWVEVHHEGSRWTDIFQDGDRRYATPVVYVPPLSVLDENGVWKNSKDEAAANAKHVAACDPDTIRALLEERDALVKLVMEMRGTLRDLRMHLHAAGRRPEECYEMSMIDDALDYERSHDALNGGGGE